jgi:hypothetical protein
MYCDLGGSFSKQLPPGSPRNDRHIPAARPAEQAPAIGVDSVFLPAPRRFGEACGLPDTLAFLKEAQSLTNG